MMKAIIKATTLSKKTTKKHEEKPRKPRMLAPRYGIAEWFGKDVSTMSTEERLAFGELAMRQIEAEKGVVVDAPQCPFLSTLIAGARCNKRGGVCSFRKFAYGVDGVATTVESDKVVTACPSRFIQEVADGKTIFAWISEKMLDTTSPIIVKETPFLRKISDLLQPLETKIDSQIAEDVAEEAEDEKKAGRIDWILVNPNSMNSSDLDWCAVETQALYFSGDKMELEFAAHSKNPNTLLFPTGKRRPDYRSSGPKRLSPQLDVKVPVLRNWGKKVVIVIDRYFFENMNRLDDSYSRAKDDRARRDNAEIIWFIVDYDDEMRLRAGDIIYTTLESSRKALNATEPLSKVDFTNNLKAVINRVSRGNKVFRASKSEALE